MQRIGGHIAERCAYCGHHLDKCSTTVEVLSGTVRAHIPCAEVVEKVVRASGWSEYPATREALRPLAWGLGPNINQVIRAAWWGPDHARGVVVHQWPTTWMESLEMVCRLPPTRCCFCLDSVSSRDAVIYLVNGSNFRAHRACDRTAHDIAMRLVDLGEQVDSTPSKVCFDKMVKALGRNRASRSAESLAAEHGWSQEDRQRVESLLQ